MNNVVPKHSGSKVYSAKKYKGPRKQHIKQFSTLIIIRNVPKQHIRMISEGSCEDRSNDCWKFIFAITGINNILRYIKM